MQASFPENRNFFAALKPAPTHHEGLKLIIVHYHLRAGGVRRVIELAAPHLCRAARLDSIVLACGEASDRAWNETFVRRAAPARVEFFIQPAFRYLSEQRHSPAQLRPKIDAAIHRLLNGATGQDCLVWAHNLGIARNLLLTGALATACEHHGVSLVAHHHDWWFDNRWLRWREMQRSGVRSLAAAAKTIFPATKTIQHVAINRADSNVLRRHFRKRAHWLPNLAERATPPTAQRIRQARHWLNHRVGGTDEPVWILPCRLLRRKNIAEALLLARWLRPKARLITTGGVSSTEEQPYSEKLAAAARRHEWPLHLGILARDQRHQPSVAELMAVSECVMLTSIQEGFGLPYLEAAAAGRPLIARTLPNIAPDLARFGFRFPQSYPDILVHTDLFDWSAEQARQARQFGRWKNQLPVALRWKAGNPDVLIARAKPAATPFSRLTLDAQIEVLAQPVERSWKLCAPLNRFLSVWRQRATRGTLAVTPWPRTADGWLSGQSYAARLLRIRRQPPSSPPGAQDAVDAQEDFFEKSLAARNTFPLLWNSEV
jgi:glycosyltransferase involved in cell wall biosynthesis